MTRQFTLDQLVSRLEKMTDAENDTHLSTTEKQEIIASSAAETWDHIVASGLGERFTKLANFSSVSGQRAYDLTSSTYIPDQDFYKLQSIYIDEGGGHLRPLERINPAEVRAFRPPPASIPVVFYYIPCAPTFKDNMGAFDGTKTFDGINGWEEHTLVTAAITVKMKKEDDYSGYARRKAELEERIAHMGSQDASQPARVTRRRGTTRAGYWYPYHGMINAYGIRGNNLELYYSYPWVP